MKTFTQLSPTNALKTLCWLRTFAVAGQAVVILLAVLELSMELPLTPMLLTVAALAVWNLAAYWRLTKPWSATPAEIFLNLAADVTALTFLLYWSGGATNPFVSLYLLPVAIAASALPARLVWGIALMCVGYYSFLMLFYIPLPPIHEDLRGDFNAHILGMWINFILSAAVIAIFVARISRAVRERDQALGEAREEALRNEKIVALGTLSAGVAHEISTPLSTMTMVVDELRAQPDQDAALQQELTLLGNQITICKEKIKELLDSAGHTRSEGGRAVNLRHCIAQLLDRWQMIRPEIEAEITYNEPFQDLTILAEQTITQSITNLLNNAADATVENGRTRIEVALKSTNQQLTLVIDDQGKGITQEQTEMAGRVSFTTKESGHGIGLVLSNASLGRFGGEVLLQGRPEGGTRTEVKLPLKALIIEDGESHE